MQDETIALIYAVKKNLSKYEQLKDIAVDFYMQRSASARETYTYDILYSLIKGAFIDYIGTADKPDEVLAYYFNSHNIVLQLNPNIGLIELELQCMLKVFLMAQVKDSCGNYINGFK